MIYIIDFNQMCTDNNLRLFIKYAVNPVDQSILMQQLLKKEYMFGYLLTYRRTDGLGLLYYMLVVHNLNIARRVLQG